MKFAMPRARLLLLLGLVAALVAVAAGVILTSPTSSEASGLHLTGTAAGLSVALEISPGVYGQNRFLVTVHDAAGKALQDAEVQLNTDMLDMGMSSPDLGTAPVSEGRYQAVGPLNMPGNWRISAKVQAPGLPAGGATVPFTLRIGTATKAMPTPLPELAAVAGGVPPTPTPVPIAPLAVQWAALPYRAAISFLTNGLVYLPGQSALLKTGALNHSIARVPGHEEAWVTDYANNDVAVVDLATSQLLTTIPVGLGPVHIVFTSDGKRAWVTNLLSSEVSVVDVAARHVVATVPVGLYPHGLALSPDGKQVWVACGRAGGLWVLDAHTNAVINQVPAGLQPHGVTFSPDGKTVYMTDAGAGDLVILNSRSGAVLARVAIHTGSAMDAALPDGSRVYVTGQGGSVVTVVDTKTQQVIGRIPVGSGPHGLALTPDGSLLYVAVNNANHVSVIDTKTDRVIATVPVPGSADELILWH